MARRPFESELVSASLNFLRELVDQLLAPLVAVLIAWSGNHIYDLPALLVDVVAGLWSILELRNF